MPGAYDRAFSEAQTGAILEFELLDSDLPPRGLAMGEIIGQGIDSGADVPVVHISPRAAAETTPVAVHTQINTRSVECSTAEWAARCACHVRAGQAPSGQRFRHSKLAMVYLPVYTYSGALWSEIQVQKIGHGLLACVRVLRRPLVRDSDTVNWPWFTCPCASTQAPSGQRFRYRELTMVYLPVYLYSGALWSDASGGSGYEDELRHEHALLFEFLVDEGERLRRVP